MGFHRPKHPFPPHQPKSPLRRGRLTCVGGAEKGCSIKHTYKVMRRKKKLGTRALFSPPATIELGTRFFPRRFFSPRLLFSSLSSFFSLSSLPFPSLLFLSPFFSSFSLASLPFPSLLFLGLGYDPPYKLEKTCELNERIIQRMQ